MTGNGIATRLAILRDNLVRLAEIPQATFSEFAADFRNDARRVHEILTTHRRDLASLLDLLLAIPD